MAVGLTLEPPISEKVDRRQLTGFMCAALPDSAVHMHSAAVYSARQTAPNVGKCFSNLFSKDDYMAANSWSLSKYLKALLWSCPRRTLLLVFGALLASEHSTSLD